MPEASTSVTQELANIGRALRWLREERGLRQFEVAEAASLTRPMVSAYETGKQLPTLVTLVKLLDALDADLADLTRMLQGMRMAGRAASGKNADPVAAESQAFARLEVALLGWLRELRSQILVEDKQDRMREMVKACMADE